MQEEVTQKTIALSMKTGKLTAQVLQMALKKFLEAQKHGPKLHQGQQSLKQLKQHGAALSNIEITDANIAAFKPCAKKYGVDFTLRKDKTTQPPHYIVSVFLTTPDDIFVCDPEAEYFPLVQRLHGQVIKLSPTSRDYVNPLDINLNYSEDENPLALKSDFVLSFCELVMGGKNGLEPIEKTVIDRAVQVIYRPYLADPNPEKMPVLSDLHAALLAQHIPEADRVAQALDLYVSGSLNVFNHRTNVDIENRLVCFDIKDLGKQLKKLGMLIVQDQIWGRVTANRSMGKATWYFADELT